MSSTVATQLPTGTWSIDPIHSSIGFGVKHLVGKVKGEFKDFEGTFNFDPKAPAKATSARVTRARTAKPADPTAVPTKKN